MSGSEEENIKPQPKKKRASGGRFRRQRTFCRKRAMQFLYGLDVCRDWQIGPMDLDLFKEMLDDLDEDSETLDQAAREGAYPYLEELIYGVREHLDDIDVLIRKAARNWRLERMGPVDRCILRVAVYEMSYVKKVSAATAINEAIEISKLFGQAETPRFVNGVLERIRQLIEEPEKEPAEAETAEAGNAAAEAGNAAAEAETAEAGNAAAEAETAEAGNAPAEAETAEAGNAAAEAETAEAGNATAEAETAEAPAVAPTVSRFVLDDDRDEGPKGASIFGAPSESEE